MIDQTATPLVQQIQPYFVTFCGITLVGMGAVVTALAARFVALLKVNTSIARETHTLVNSQMGNVLQIGAISAQSLYEKEPSAQNLALLNQATTALNDHIRKQTIVDAGDNK
jgi:hypothetical protein